jgi:tryptophanyl-tRNA synthetase
MQDYESGALKYVDLKEAVANGLVALNEQFRTARAELNANKKDVKNQVKASSAEIRKRAQETIKQVKDLAGLLNVRF